jgi:hypothetical protein
MNQKQEPFDVREPLFELLNGLDFAFNQKSDNPPSAQIEREQLVAALTVVGRFLLKVKPPHADRFFDLSDALGDLNIGARPPILRGPKKRSAPNATKIEAAKACVAFALDALIELGESSHAAATMLVEKYDGIKWLAGQKSHRSDNLWEKTILEWRKSLSAPSRKKNDLAAEIFAAGRELIKFLIETDRRGELKARAIGRAKYAAKIGVFLAASNTR